MGTKNNPSKFDCYANAAPDEPMFVLLGRDKHAAVLVSLWALLRRLDGEERAITAEAEDCARALAAYCEDHGKSPVTIDHVTLVATLRALKPNAEDAAQFLQTALRGLSAGRRL